jgi:transposase
MLQITPQMKILVAVEPADFRRGIDGLARLCQETLQHDPFAGAVFVFRTRKGTALKVLMYDGQGFWLCHKRLSQGRFPWWPSEGGNAALGRPPTVGVALGRQPDANRCRSRLASGGPSDLMTR